MNNFVVFSTDIEKERADIFDSIAEKNFRSRAQHLKYLVEAEIDKNAAKDSDHE